MSARLPNFGEYISNQGLYDLEIFSTAVLSLNFDPDLSKSKMFSFFDVEQLRQIFEKWQKATNERTNKQTNKHA